jgi:hypothetical protein
MTGAISVVQGAAEAFGFLRRSWLRAAGVLALCAVLDAALVLSIVNRDFGRAGALAVAALLSGAMARGALFRLALAHRRPGEEDLAPGFLGFQWGRVEWRLLAVVLLRAFLFGVLIALLLTVLVSLYVGLAAAQPGSGGVAKPEHWRRTLDPVSWTVVGSAALAGAAGLVWVALRVFVAFPATVATGRTQLLSTWPLTRGHTWRIFGAAALVLAAPLALGCAGRAVSDPAWSVVIAAAGDALLGLPLSAGLMSYVYDRLCPDAVGAA